MSKVVNERMLKSLLKKIQKEKDIIASARDRLRAIYDDLDGLTELFDDGLDSIQYGIDRISEQV